MDGFTTYKMLRKPKPKLMELPPYCRKSEKCGDKESKKPPVKLEVSDPAKILELCESLTDSQSLGLEKKINKYIKSETEAENVFIISLLPSSEEAFVQVLSDNILESDVRLPISEEVVQNLADSQHSSIASKGDLDPELRAVIETVVGTESCLVYTVPVVICGHKEIRWPGASHTVPLLVCVVNSPKEQHFVSRLVYETFQFCLTLLLNTSTSEEEARLKRQCQSLLAVARKFFSHLGDLSDLLREIMTEARRLTNSERCSLFLLDPDHMHLVAKVFDGVAANEVTTEVRIAKDQGIAGHVAATGKVLNIRDAYSHPLFYKGMDEATGFRTRNILCFPIRDENGIIGVAQLCNKIGGHFDYYDQEVAVAFSIYCGISIVHSLVYKKIQDAQARSKLSNELMIYHMKVHTADVLSVVLCPNFHPFEYFQEFSYSPRNINQKETICYALKMFEDLGFIEKFRLKKEVLTRFLLYAQKAYRDMPYHNWTHAFSVAHFGYMALKKFELVERGFLSDLEALAYITACFCHDIDHRGTTNAFQLKASSTLASLYSSEGSVMEHHHLAQTLCILNTENCNFLDVLCNAEYERCLDLIRDMILATDLANHFKILPKQKILCQIDFDKYNGEHKFLLCSLLMTCADLSDQTKDWIVTKQIASQIYDEFFNQGDLEKSMEGKCLESMDREKASIPELQIEFLQDVCLPAFKVLTKLLGNTFEIISSLYKNIRCWEHAKPIFEKLCRNGNTSMEVLAGVTLETEVQCMLDALENI